MVELRERPDGQLTRGWGGDTLNTAVYLARLGVAVDYVTALGDDPWSDEMVAGWRAEGVGTGHVVRLPGRLPGLYVIQTDPRGERRFSYWRDRAPARDLFELPETAEIVDALGAYDWLYVSGITLSLYGAPGRARLLEAVDRARDHGGQLAFDTNFRPRGWPDRDVARAAYVQAARRAAILLASTEDLQLLFGAPDPAPLTADASAAELVLKLPEPACRIMAPGLDRVVAAEPVAEVVDTTAAGDSFAAAYLAARLAGGDPLAAAHAGHRLAGAVVSYAGAIIPRAAMPGVPGKPHR